MAGPIFKLPIVNPLAPGATATAPRISPANRFNGPLFGVKPQPIGQGPLRSGVLANAQAIRPTRFSGTVPGVPALEPELVQGTPLPSADTTVIEVGVAAQPSAPAGRTLSTDAFVMARILESICASLSALSDDLYNAAAIQNGTALALVAGQSGGQHTFAPADMAADAPQPSAKAWTAYANNSQYPVLAVVRIEPFFSGQPPNALTDEGVILLAALDASSCNDPSKAPIVFPSAGVPLSIVIPPNQTLYVNAMASGQVKAVVSILPLRGRQMIFTAG